MARKKVGMKVKRIGAKIDFLRIGPKWTSIKVSIPTSRLQFQTARAVPKKK